MQCLVERPAGRVEALGECVERYPIERKPRRAPLSTFWAHASVSATWPPVLTKPTMENRPPPAPRGNAEVTTQTSSRLGNSLELHKATAGGQLTSVEALGQLRNESLRYVRRWPR
jgi:hypothetical protein